MTWRHDGQRWTTVDNDEDDEEATAATAGLGTCQSRAPDTGKFLFSFIFISLY